MDAPKVDTGPDKTVRTTQVAGIPVHIERPKGTIKLFPEGYTQFYKNHYGSTPLAKGVDGDPLDVFVGPDRGSKRVFVVDKMVDKNHSKFDEHKVMLGFRSLRDARESAEFHLWGTDGKIREMGLQKFLKSIRGGKDMLKKASEYSYERCVINPMVILGFTGSIADSAKVAFSLGDVPAEVWGALAGGTIGGLGGYSATEDETKKTRNAALGGLAGATAGAGLARLFKSDSSGEKLTNRPGSSPVRPMMPEQGKLEASQVEPTLQRSEAAVRQQAQQQMTQQAIQTSAAREKALLLRDQGQVAARTQELLAPRGIPAMPGARPRNIVVAPGVIQLAPSSPRVARNVTRAMGKQAGLPDVDWGKILGFVQSHPEVATGALGAGLGAGVGWSTADQKTRKRKMLMGMLLGGGFGAGAGYLGNQMANAASALESGGQALGQAAAGSAGASTDLLDALRDRINSPEVTQAVAQTGAMPQAITDIIGRLVAQ